MASGELNLRIPPVYLASFFTIANDTIVQLRDNPGFTKNIKEEFIKKAGNYIQNNPSFTQAQKVDFISKIPTYLASFFTIANDTLIQLHDNPGSIKSIEEEFIKKIENYLQKTPYYNSAQKVDFISNIKEILNKLKDNPNNNLFIAYFFADLDQAKVITSIRRHPNIQSLLLNASFDLFEYNNFKFFVGGGLGASFIQEKVSVNVDLLSNNKTINLASSTHKSQLSTNLAYSLSLGSSYLITPNTAIEIKYSFKDLGKSASLKFEGIELGNLPYRSHILAAGVKYNF